MKYHFLMQQSSREVSLSVNPNEIFEFFIDNYP